MTYAGPSRADLESVLGATPQEFESLTLRHADQRLRSVAGGSVRIKGSADDLGPHWPESGQITPRKTG